MAESNKTILTLGALIIAGVALFFIGSYVGNAFYSPKSTLTTTQKGEVLWMLNKCKSVSLSENFGTTKGTIIGDDACIAMAPGTRCIFSAVKVERGTFVGDDSLLSLRGCKEGVPAGNYLEAMCCLP